MLKRALLLFVVLALAAAPTFASSKNSAGSGTDRPKSVSVKAHTKKDGTVVRAHKRAAPSKSRKRR